MTDPTDLTDDFRVVMLTTFKKLQDENYEKVHDSAKNGVKNARSGSVEFTVGYNSGLIETRNIGTGRIHSHSEDAKPFDKTNPTYESNLIISMTI